MNTELQDSEMWDGKLLNATYQRFYFQEKRPDCFLKSIEINNARSTWAISHCFTQRQERGEMRVSFLRKCFLSLWCYKVTSNNIKMHNIRVTVSIGYFETRSSLRWWTVIGIALGNYYYCWITAKWNLSLAPNKSVLKGSSTFFKKKSGLCLWQNWVLQVLGK